MFSLRQCRLLVAKLLAHESRQLIHKHPNMVGSLGFVFELKHSGLVLGYVEHGGLNNYLRQFKDLMVPGVQLRNIGFDEMGYEVHPGRMYALVMAASQPGINSTSASGKNADLSSGGPEIAPDVSQHAHKLQSMYAWLTEMLLAKRVADEMYQSRALALPHMEKVNACSTECEAAKQLLSFVLSPPYDKVSGFMEAVAKTNQQHLYKGFDDRYMFVNVIRNNYIFLLGNMDLKNSQLLDYLFTDFVLTMDQKEEVEAETTSTDANRQLLSLLVRKSPDDFNKFIKALRETNQEYIADRLTSQQT